MPRTGLCSGLRMVSVFFCLKVLNLDYLEVAIGELGALVQRQRWPMQEVLLKEALMEAGFVGVGSFSLQQLLSILLMMSFKVWESRFQAWSRWWTREVEGYSLADFLPETDRGSLELFRLSFEPFLLQSLFSLLMLTSLNCAIVFHFLDPSFSTFSIFLNQFCIWQTCCLSRCNFSLRLDMLLRAIKIILLEIIFISIEESKSVVDHAIQGIDLQEQVDEEQTYQDHQQLTVGQLLAGWRLLLAVLWLREWLDLLLFQSFFQQIVEFLLLASDIFQLGYKTLKDKYLLLSEDLSQNSDAHFAFDHDLQTADNIRLDDLQKLANRVTVLLRYKNSHLKHAPDLPVAVIECLGIEFRRSEEDVKLIKRISRIVGLIYYISLRIGELKVAVNIFLQFRLKLLLFFLRILPRIERNIDPHRHIPPHLHSQLIHPQPFQISIGTRILAGH